MAKYERLAALLPSLYRPEHDDETLLNRLLQSTGAVLDQASVQANHVMFAHWFDVADKATWDAHHQTERRERGLPPVNVRNAKDQREILNYPYISDLGRLCGLLGISPWREPALLRETVEEYRQRVTDLLEAYRLGLTTVPALRRLIEAELPEDMTGSLANQRWPFAIEEPRSLGQVRLSVEVPESPVGKAISPLWRWNTPAKADPLATPTVYLQGVSPGGPLVATTRPGIECVTPFANPLGVALAYTGTLAPNQTLRLQPARRSWLVRDQALFSATLPTPTTPGDDPGVHDFSSNGPWQALSGVPTGAVLALSEAVDHSLWLILRDDDTDTLYRYDGSTFTAVSDGSPKTTFTCVRCYGSQVFLGTAQGLYQAALFPVSGSYSLSAVATVVSAVHQLAVVFNHLTIATQTGAISLNSDLSVHKQWLTGTPVYAVLQREQTLLLGVDAGLVRCRGTEWALYDGATTSEDQPDWRVLPEGEIATAAGGVAAVTQLALTPDGGLWLGNATGLARYYARAQESGNAFQTVLEAFPDLCSAVNSLQVDERGMLWIAAAEGLLRYDGRDFAQYDFTNSLWQPLGQANTAYPDEVTAEPRSHWRYSRSETRWERFHPRQRRFTGAALSLRTQAGSVLQAVLFTQTVIAELGQFDGTTFTAQGVVSHAELRVRIKPDQTRVLDGGLPAVPRPLTAASSWRYIQLEPQEFLVPNDRPWWSTEGQLFPEPHAKLPWPGHFRGNASLFKTDAHSFDPNTTNESDLFDPFLSNEAAIFIYPPSAQVWMAWPSHPRIGVKVRLFKRGGQPIDPAITDRVWASLQRARAASVPVALLVEDAIVHTSIVQATDLPTP